MRESRLNTYVGKPPCELGRAIHFAHTGGVVSRQYELTLGAVARLDRATNLLLSPRPPEPKGAVWTPELIDRIVEGMRACRWFVATGFEPPRELAVWLRTNMEQNQLRPGSLHGDFHGAAVWYAAEALDHLREEWRPDWSPAPGTA